MCRIRRQKGSMTEKTGVLNISYKINRDPEVWELTDLFGDRALRVWLEVLSSANSSGNKWVGNQYWISTTANTVRLWPVKVQKIVQWMIEKRWLESTTYGAECSTKDDPSLNEGSTKDHPSIVLSVFNYAKYNNLCDLSHGNLKTQRVSSSDKEKEGIGHPFHKRKERAKKQRMVTGELEWPIDPRFDKVWEAFPKKRSKGEAETAWHRDLRPSDELVEQILAKIAEGRQSDAWCEVRFIPNLSTWLRGKGWLDDFSELKKVKRMVL